MKLDEDNFLESAKNLIIILKGITQKLRLFSSLLLSLLLFDIGLVVYFSMTRKTSSSGFSSYSSYREQEITITTFSLAICISAILIIFMFYNLRNRGMAIYEEITDEIDYNNKSGNGNRLPIELRVTIKDFLKSTDLPFTTGTNGQAFYLVLFLTLLLSVILLKTS